MWNGSRWVGKTRATFASPPIHFTMAVLNQTLFLLTQSLNSTLLSMSSDLLTFSHEAASFPTTCASPLTMFAHQGSLLTLQSSCVDPSKPLAYSSHLTLFTSAPNQTSSWSGSSPLTPANVDCAVRRIAALSNSSGWTARSAFRVFNRPHLVQAQGLFFLFFSAPFADVHPAVLHTLFKEENVTANSDTLYYLLSTNITGPFVSPTGNPNAPGVVRAPRFSLFHFICLSPFELISTKQGGGAWL